MEHEKRDEIVRRYTSGESSLALSNEFKIHRRYIARWVAGAGFSMRNPRGNGKFSKEQKEAIAKEYASGKPVGWIASHYGVAEKGIPDIVHLMGGNIRPSGLRTCSLREDAFDVITEESAYWIGFIMADGCIARSRGRISGMHIGLSEVDADHLQNLKGFLGYDGATGYHPAKKIDNTKYISKPSYSLSITSVALAKSLMTYGVVPAKSLIAEVVGLEDNRHFWRGAIDGNGWIIAKEIGKSPLFGLMGSEKLMRQYARFISDSDGKPPPKLQSRGKIFGVVLQGFRAAQISRMIYGNCSVALPRKLEKALIAMAYNKPARSNSYPAH